MVGDAGRGGRGGEGGAGVDNDTKEGTEDRDPGEDDAGDVVAADVAAGGDVLRLLSYCSRAARSAIDADFLRSSPDMRFAWFAALDPFEDSLNIVSKARSGDGLPCPFAATPKVGCALKSLRSGSTGSLVPRSFV